MSDEARQIELLRAALNNALNQRDEAIREVSRLGRELGTEQARLAEAVEWVREARKFCQDGLAGDGCTPQQALERIHEASGDILAKLEGRSDAIRAMEEKP